VFVDALRSAKTVVAADGFDAHAAPASKPRQIPP
jgi:hypothetical protein